MKVREKIDRNLSHTESEIDFYQSINQEGDYSDKLDSLTSEKARLLERADHYDREQAAGFLKPCTNRWRK